MTSSAQTWSRKTASRGPIRSTWAPAGSASTARSTRRSSSTRRPPTSSPPGDPLHRIDLNIPSIDAPTMPGSIRPPHRDQRLRQGADAQGHGPAAGRGGITSRRTPRHQRFGPVPRPVVNKALRFWITISAPRGRQRPVLRADHPRPRSGPTRDDPRRLRQEAGLRRAVHIRCAPMTTGRPACRIARRPCPTSAASGQRRPR